MVPYVAILVRGEDEAWRAYPPDFIGCRGGRFCQSGAGTRKESSAAIEQWCREADTAQLD